MISHCSRSDDEHGLHLSSNVYCGHSRSVEKPVELQQQSAGSGQLKDESAAQRPNAAAVMLENKRQMELLTAVSQSTRLGQERQSHSRATTVFSSRHFITPQLSASTSIHIQVQTVMAQIKSLKKVATPSYCLYTLAFTF